jgi:ACS family hexuronate transporter-like MFS transporter
MVMGIVAPTLRADFHIDAMAYGWITAAFSTCYAVGQLISGKWLDRVGTRFGYGTAVGAWSLTSILHAASRSVPGFIALRAILGITESPAYPGAVKTISEWFPKRERAYAMGWANSGSCAGTIIALLLVPVISMHFGWRGAFLVTGGLGLLWLPFWIAFYRKPSEHRRVSAEELAYINSDPFESTARVPWRKLLLFRQTWGFALGKFCTDPIWAFYLFWLPTFLFDRFGILKTAIIVPTIAIYLMADTGSVVAGWLSSTLIKRGYSINRARKFTMFICACCTLPGVFIPLMPNLWSTVLLVGIALAAHQGFASNLFTVVSDVFPRRAVGSVTGIGGLFGYMGYSLFGVLTGWILILTHDNYLPIFVICALGLSTSLIIIHLLMPRLEIAVIEDEATPA